MVKCQYAPKLGKAEAGKQSVNLMDATMGRAVLRQIGIGPPVCLVCRPLALATDIPEKP